MYCNRKDELRSKAVKHTEKMEREYLGEITQAHRASIIYDDKNVPPAKRDGDPEYALLKKDSISALFSKKGRYCVLNFASYRNPGGNFIGGSMA